MNTKLEFSNAREKALVPVQDIAYLLATDGSSLSKIERGIRRPNMETVFLYHILFGVALKDFFGTEQIQILRMKYINRANRLIANLKYLDTPKSKNRLKYIGFVVQKLNHIEL